VKGDTLDQAANFLGWRSAFRGWGVHGWESFSHEGAYSLSAYDASNIDWRTASVSKQTRRPLFAALILCSLLLFGQDNSQQTQKLKATAPLQIIVTGCLKKNASGGFSVADQSGKTWELTSKKIDLAKYVFNTISASGHPSTGLSDSKEGSNEQNPEGGGQRFRMDVMDLTVVSRSCTR
jgi:hypothetical protein